MGNFEKIIEHIVNNNEKAARALFHKEVVNVSRKIYEDMDDSPKDYHDEVESEETAGDFKHGESGEVDDDFIDDDDFDEVGGDQVDDLVADTEHSDEDVDEPMNDEFGTGDEFAEDEGNIEDRVVNIEDSLDELKAEFEKIAAEHEVAEPGDEEGDEDLEASEEDVEDADEDLEDADEDLTDFEDEESEDEDVVEDVVEDDDDEEDFVREYVEKVAKPSNSEEASVNKRGPAMTKKNDMGGTAKNLVQGGDEKGRTAPTSKELIGKVGNTGGQGKGQQLRPAPKAKNAEDAGTNKKGIL